MHEKDKSWYMSVSNHKEYECHYLSRNELMELLHEEWDKAFNTITIGRDVDCIGRLIVFFYESKAYVAYEDFEKDEWLCSYDLDAFSSNDWDELINITPSNFPEHSYPKCAIVSKDRAMNFITNYIDNDSLKGLYITNTDGNPAALDSE